MANMSSYELVELLHRNPFEHRLSFANPLQVQTGCTNDAIYGYHRAWSKVKSNCNPGLNFEGPPSATIVPETSPSPLVIE